MKPIIITLLLLFTTFVNAQEYKVEFQKILVQKVESSVKITCPSFISVPTTIKIDGEIHPWPNGEETAVFLFTPTDKKPTVTFHQEVYESATKPIPLWLSILPPLIAILLALVFREVLSALFLGIFGGAAIIEIYAHGISGLFSGFLTAIDHFIINSLTDTGHLSVVIFSMMIGAMVHVISKNGGMNSIVKWLSKKATTARSGQMATYIMGILIFFDDYANTLVVGNTMRPMTDKLKISREKLSYIVDSTAAPVAAIAFVTTWIGAELGYIGNALAKENVVDYLGEQSAYGVFFQSIPYSFYPLLTLVFIFMLVYTQKDFGPMLKAERNARSGRNSHEIIKENKEPFYSSVWNAIIPIIIIVFGTLTGLLYTGWDSNVWNGTESFGVKLSSTIGNADSYVSLLWSSLFALITAITMSLAVAKQKFNEMMEAAMDGFKTMLPAVLILVLAWSLASVTETLHTADFLTGIMRGGIYPAWIPPITFILAGLIAFATGSSWGTMAILYPLVLPALTTLCLENGLEASYGLELFANSAACVLAGSVLGDHCSPISDTTILSSLATNCNHIAHVKTQLPYALTVGGTTLILGVIPSAFGISPLIMIPVCGVTLFFVIKFVGKKV